MYQNKNNGKKKTRNDGMSLNVVGNLCLLKTKRKLGYHVCVNCSTVSAKRGIPVMRGTGDHTWVDLEVMTQEQFERYEEMEKIKTKI